MHFLLYMARSPSVNPLVSCEKCLKRRFDAQRKMTPVLCVTSYAKTKAQISCAVTVYCTADQRLFFRYIDSTIPLLPIPKFQASSHLVQSYSLVCVGHGRKPRRPVFSQRCSLSAIVSKESDLSRIIRKPAFCKA